MSSGPTPPLQKPPGYQDPNNPAGRAPPRRPGNVPPSFGTKRRRSFCRTYYCWCCIVSMLLFILLISISAFFYAFYHPQLPEIHVASMKITRFDVQSSADGAILNSESSIRVEIKNPNSNLEIKYNRTSILIRADDGGVNLGKSVVPGFIQAANNVTSMDIKVKAKQVVANEVAERMKTEYQSKNLKVSVELDGGVGVKGAGWSTSPVLMNVACRGVRLSELQDSAGSNPKCQITVFDWVRVH
ncbi:NDR1/HIN1-like protein 13 [Andrographis paniculata]|uniref:NDR1/HIN1-like protein 13 n=1 Tax=Andrographis paniculata TaxID=175694 RepID=UPI0021E7FD9C|nr:NDR1/HIN1-like protein 13 [Andrographis paniculata]